MRTQKTEVKTYICEHCERDYENASEAEACEQSHFKFKVGDVAVHRTGYYGSEQGQAHPNWERQDRGCKVVKVNVDEYLVEYEDGERVWAYRWDMLEARS